ncbi:MAG: hypothetical protein OEZ36_02825 [Spirochaetota bacterium]|nr:hypothetical protein [Spirochaetota bacterium]
MKEKRSEHRKLTFLSIYEYGDKGNGSPGLLMNLTSRGATILIREQEKELPEHICIVIYPPNKASATNNIILKARKIWEKQGITPLYHLLGCEFEELNPEILRLVQLLL